jgi:hypothetical protein
MVHTDARSRVASVNSAQIKVVAGFQYVAASCGVVASVSRAGIIVITYNNGM